MQVTKSLQQNTSHYSIHNIIREDSTNYSHNKSEIQSNKRLNVLKRIPIDRLMDLKIDYTFKQLFGVEKNKQITVVFLNAILQKTGNGDGR